MFETALTRKVNDFDFDFIPVCGSSFDSYNSFGLNPLSYNSQASFNASNTSFNTTTNTSLLDQTFGGNSTNFNPNQNPYVAGPSYGQPKPTYNQSSVNLQTIAMSGNYSPNTSNYINNYDGTATYSQNTPSSYETSYDNLARKSIDDHMKKQLDEQLMSKVSEKLTLEQVTKLLAQKQLEYKSTSNIILNQIQTSEEIARSCRDIATDKEEFC